MADPRPTEYRPDPMAWRAVRRRVLPAGWTTGAVENDGAMYHDRTGLKVIASVGVELDGRRWLHVSLSRVLTLPSWADIGTVKDIFVGPNLVAVQVFPRGEDYVNIHTNCLHLWCCLDEDAVPNFARARGGQI